MGPVVKNLPSNTGDTGLIPGQGTETPHATGQLSPRTCFTTRETTTEAPITAMKSLCAAQPKNQKALAHFENIHLC